MSPAIVLLERCGEIFVCFSTWYFPSEIMMIRLV